MSCQHPTRRQYWCRDPTSWLLSSLTFSSSEATLPTPLLAIYSHGHHLSKLAIAPHLEYEIHIITQCDHKCNHPALIHYTCSLPSKIPWSYFSPILNFTLLPQSTSDSSIPHFSHCRTDILPCSTAFPSPHMQIPTLTQFNHVTLDHWTWLEKNHPLDRCHKKIHTIQNIWVTE